MAILASDWATLDQHEVMKGFKFVFLIKLRNIDKKSKEDPLETVILDQHGSLKTEGISPTEIKSIVHREKGILMLLDGLDEYTMGTNRATDNLIRHGHANYLTLLSSRPGYFLKPIKDTSHEEVTITGFDDKNIEKCATQFLKSSQKCLNFLAEARRAGVYELLRVPIILFMACMIFEENLSLPSNKTALVEQILFNLITRTLKKTRKLEQRLKSSKDLDELLLPNLLVRLGKLAWEALNKPRQLFLSKV